MIGVALVGTGRMGAIRGRAAARHPGCRVVVACDQDGSSARTLGSELGCDVATEWEKVVGRNDVDAVVVAVPHKFLAAIAAKAATSGKHVFCEKPVGRRANELQPLTDVVDAGDVTFVVGFTLRHYAAMAQARGVVKKGDIGRVMFVRGRYGHGGRPGYDREWRADPDLSGRGELLDQGVHLIDLARWFAGDFTEVTGVVATSFWDMPVEDNGFILGRMTGGAVASLHASWTQWRNLFSFEVFGTDGSVVVEGLSGHYGDQKLIVSRTRLGGAPDESIFSSSDLMDGSGDVWDAEWGDFIASVEEGAPSERSASLSDASAALRVVDAVAEGSRDLAWITL